MRPLGIIVGVICGVGALAAVIWVGQSPPQRKEFVWEKGTYERQKPLIERNEAEEAAAKKAAAADAEKDVEPPPPVADKAPYPKAVTSERVFEFGRMGVNEEKKHTFTLENKGQAPLKIAKGPTTCKCTISNLAQREIPPGGHANIEMAWTPKRPENPFTQTAKIFTNDPEQTEIAFKVYGRVSEVFQLYPAMNWHAGHVTELQEGKVVGRLLSDLTSNFEIKSIETESPHIEVRPHKMSKMELERSGGRGGYEITVTVDRDIPVGPFRSRFKMHTTLEGNKTISVDVTATRSGPILYLPPVAMIGRGAAWSAETARLNLGRFDHEVGAKVALPALIYGMKENEKLKVLDIKSAVSFVKTTVEPNPEISQGKQQGVRFVFEIPAGSPPVTRITPNAVPISISTNHPKLKVIQFNLEFVSQ